MNWTRFLRYRPAALGLLVVLLLTLGAVLAPWVAPFDVHYQNEITQDAPPGTLDEQVPHVHWMGTDDLGRDIFSRVLYGLRVSLFVGVATDGLVLVIGLPLGMAAGYWGGILDEILMRLVDLVSAFPSLLLAMVLVAALGHSLSTLVLALAFTRWGLLARLVRGQTLQARQQDYIVSAITVGASPLAILRRHILPNILGPVLVTLTLIIPSAIIAEATLTFLGLGIDTTIPTLGGMVNSGMGTIFSSPTEVMFPALVLAVLALAFTYIGEGIVVSNMP